jgi:hypothetical protein
MKKIILCIVCLLFSNFCSSQPDEFLIRCIGVGKSIRDPGGTTTLNLDEYYLFRYNSPIRPNRGWVIEKTLTNGDSSSVFQVKKFELGDKLDLETKINVTDSMITIFTFWTGNEGKNYGKYDEKINRISGVWTIRSDRKGRIDGSGLDENYSVDGQCSRVTRKI